MVVAAAVVLPLVAVVLRQAVHGTVIVGTAVWAWGLEWAALVAVVRWAAAHVAVQWVVPWVVQWAVQALVVVLWVDRWVVQASVVVQWVAQALVVVQWVALWEVLWVVQ